MRPVRKKKADRNERDRVVRLKIERQRGNWFITRSHQSLLMLVSSSATLIVFLISVYNIMQRCSGREASHRERRVTERGQVSSRSRDSSSELRPSHGSSVIYTAAARHVAKLQLRGLAAERSFTRLSGCIVLHCTLLHSHLCWWNGLMPRLSLCVCVCACVHIFCFLFLATWLRDDAFKHRSVFDPCGWAGVRMWN